MTAKEFNFKWKDHLEPVYYGMDIDIPEVVDYMNAEFHKEINNNPDFIYSQIKLKFGYARVYTSSSKDGNWENEIERIIKERK